jgi:glycosyltransferase involved in cell wall biosynthesis
VNPVRSGISDYSEALLAELRHSAEIDLFVHGYQPSEEWVRGHFKVIDCSEIDPCPQLGEYDCVLYQMGGTPSHHEYMYRIMLRHPGVLVLHDLMYQGFFEELLLKQGKVEEYVALMERCYGEQGVKIAQEILAGRPPPFEVLLRYPLNKEMVDAAKGVVVHSEFARQEVQRTNPSVRARLIPSHDYGWSIRGTDYDESKIRALARHALGIDEKQTMFASFGLIAPTKRIEVALRAFAEVKRSLRKARYYLVGEPTYHIHDYIRFLQLEDYVTVTGHVPMERFRLFLDAADVCVNLRYPSQGETSAAALRMLALGKASIVTDHAWFSELPDDTCAKVGVDMYEENTLVAFLKALSREGDYRAQMGANAHRYVSDTCSVRKVAGQYRDFVLACH